MSKSLDWKGRRSGGTTQMEPDSSSSLQQGLPAAGCCCGVFTLVSEPVPIAHASLQEPQGRLSSLTGPGTTQAHIVSIATNLLHCRPPY